jgi:2-oxoglutarate ferredoxin oxidoreductase subunit alpha
MRNPVMLVAEGNLGQMMEPVEFQDSYPQPYDKSSWSVTGAKDRKGAKALLQRLCDAGLPEACRDLKR